MEVQKIPLDHLTVAKANMRAARKHPHIADILPSIIKRGVIAPLFVRQNGQDGRDGHFEIVAGRRRYFASLEAVKQGQSNVSLPCIVIDEADDAEALELSMIENLLREHPDQVTQWESYTRLVKEGRSVEDIAAMFALTELQVKRILALGNLLPRIREAFRAEEIDAGTIRHLTLASKTQQKAWLALFEDADAYAPRGNQLKAWLFGGASISVSTALFDVSGFKGQIVTNLFEEDGYFADADMFWTAQTAEIEARKVQYLEDGWADVQIIPPSQHFASWEHEKTPKRKGGRVYIQARDYGEVTFYEGYLTTKEARVRRKGEAEGNGACPPSAPSRPELTAPLTAYVDLHRHAAVRTELAGQPSLAMRVMVAHAICGSPLWTVRAADQHSRNEAITTSVETCIAETAFGERRRRVLALLGFDPSGATLCEGHSGGGIVPLVLSLLELPDAAVMEVMALVMAETLSVGSEIIEVLGATLSVDMANYWQADQVFFDLLRNREVLTAILAEVGGEAAARANASEKGKVIKAVISDCLTGSGDRVQVDRWVPRWMAFPPSAYTERGGVASVTAARRAAWLTKDAARENGDTQEPDTPAEPELDDQSAVAELAGQDCQAA